MSPSSWEIIQADCIEAMRDMAEASVDAIVTDPPYGLGFMGREWDDLPPGLEFAEQALRVLKPGGHLLAFGGTRTYHRLVVALEDAGFEIRDTIAWMYGTGFPKSLDVSKAIDKAAGAEREVVGKYVAPDGHLRDKGGSRYPKGSAAAQEWPLDRAAHFSTAPATPEAEKWQGWGTALKPAFEPIVVARKPLSERTVAANVLEHGTGALNIDATRIGVEARTNRGMTNLGVMHDDDWKPRTVESTVTGRWPANVTLDEEAAAMLDEQSGNLPSQDPATGGRVGHPLFGVRPGNARFYYGDTGGASRFFYVAKASRKERGEGNDHPTVKPLALMRWLVRLVTPPDGVVLDPFTGSGTTGVAAVLEGFGFIGIEREAGYALIAKQRITEAEEAEPQAAMFR